MSQVIGADRSASDAAASRVDPGERRARRALALLLLASALVRLVLVARGGQRYWPDEVRFVGGWELLARVLAGDFGAALDQLAGTPDHTGYALVAFFPAWAQAAVLGLGGAPIDVLRIEQSLWLPAALLSTASVAVIALVFALARRAGAGPGEALLAAALAAAASTLFYYSRHLLPYDAALALALAGLWLGLRQPASLRRSLACGLLAGVAFLVYHGYWLSCAVVGALHLASGNASLRERIRRGLGFGAGLAAPALLLTLASVARGLPPYLPTVAAWSRLASTQSDPSEGASLPFAYLWHAEHGLLLAWGAGVLGALALARRGDDECAPRARLWLAALGGSYLALVSLSVGLGRVGVFGRSVRQLVPFACLATAAAAAHWLRASPLARRLAPGLGLLLLAQCAWNFATPLAQPFPAEVLREVSRDYGFVARSVTVAGSEAWETPSVPWPEETSGESRAKGLVLVDAQHLYPVLGVRPAPRGAVLREWRHPLEFLPYQYEAYTPPERALLRRAGISMRLIDLTRRDAARER